MNLKIPRFSAMHQAYLDCARLAVAVRLFEADHGAPPATLAELSPAYLASLPVQQPGDQPLAYDRSTNGGGTVRTTAYLTLPQSGTIEAKPNPLATWQASLPTTVP